MHHRHREHVFEQSPGAGDGQESLACCSPWGREESDMTERVHFHFSLSCIRMFKLVLEKSEEPEIKLPTTAGSWKKQESSRKTSISALFTKIGRASCRERV